MDCFVPDVVSGSPIRSYGRDPSAGFDRPSSAAGGRRASLLPSSLPGICSRDESMRAPLELLARAAPARIPVLLRGETGSGKEVAARALHARSPRAKGPFVAVNCGAISPELAESELFGHERGAFTGAVGQSPGAFGAADGGTLLLDEVGELPLGLQVKLLRALESDEVKPVGAARARKVDARIVAATHRDLREMVRVGTFREDLYFRLRGVEVVLPPLRQRPNDLLPLAHEILSEHEGLRLSPAAAEALLAHGWPGNVRELKQVLRLAAILCEGGVIEPRDLRLEPPLRPLSGAEPFAGSSEGTLPEPHAGSRCAEASPPSIAPPSAPEPGQRRTMAADPIQTPGGLLRLRGLSLEEIELRAVRASYVRHGGSRRAMVQELGIAKSSLLRKLDALGLRAAEEGGARAGG
jgi:DNA-binding NtrC family response regulator